MIKSRVLTRLFILAPSKYIIRLLLNLQSKKRTAPEGAVLLTIKQLLLYTHNQIHTVRLFFCHIILAVT